MNDDPREKRNGWQVIRQFCSKHTGIDLSNLTWTGKLVVGLLLVWPILPSIGGWMRALAETGSKLTSQAASVIGSTHSSAVSIKGNRNTVQINSASESEVLSFDNNKWRSGLGELTVHDDKMFLPPNVNTGTRRYIAPLPRDSFAFETRFVPFGTNAINFVISIPGVYEIVIGDSDYRHVVLKRSVKGDEVPREYVTEKKTGHTRPFLQNNLVHEKEITVALEQELLENKNLWVKVTVHYWAEKQLTKTSDVFEYEFEPSPWFEDSLFLHLGLIQDEGTKDVAARIITPPVFEELSL